MANYINRDDIIKWIDDSLEMCGDRYSVDQENMMELFRTVVNDCLPFADVAERKHGKWITKYPLSTCPVCEQTMILHDFANFCPNCGADNREENDDG